MDANKTFAGYADALMERGDFGRFFTDDVELTIVGMPETFKGREVVAELIRVMHTETFDAQPEIRALVVGDDHAAVEADFVGTHIGAYGDIAPTGRKVRVPYTVIYDLSDDGIKALRIHGVHYGLLEQLK